MINSNGKADLGNDITFAKNLTKSVLSLVVLHEG